MLFDEKVYLKKNTRYSLFAEISGPDSLCGKDGVSSVKCGDVTFTFYDSCYTAWEDEYANFLVLNMVKFRNYVLLKFLTIRSKVRQNNGVLKEMRFALLN